MLGPSGELLGRPAQTAPRPWPAQPRSPRLRHFPGQLNRSVTLRCYRSGVRFHRRNETPIVSSDSRRQFLKTGLAAAAAMAVPASIREALAIPAHNVTGTLRDVEHIVVLMQENRSFDHYFGTL